MLTYILIYLLVCRYGDLYFDLLTCLSGTVTYILTYFVVCRVGDVDLYFDLLTCLSGTVTYILTYLLVCRVGNVDVLLLDVRQRDSNLQLELVRSFIFSVSCNTKDTITEAKINFTLKIEFLTQLTTQHSLVLKIV